MKVTANGQEFIISFGYSPAKQIKKGSKHPKRYSTAYLKRVVSKEEEPVLLMQESVSNHSHDPFVRAWGRSMAFAKVLNKFLEQNEYGLSVEDKQTFVNAFYEQCPKSRLVPVEFIDLN